MKNNHKHLRLAALATLAGILSAPAAQAAATFTIINVNAAGVGFNAPTAVAPVGGNPGTTLGEQRLFAFTWAVSKWAATLDSTVNIRMEASFVALACNATQAVLGSAGALTVHGNFPNAPILETWYSQALANKIAGVDLSANNDLRARFNINLGQPGCLTGVPFYLGVDNNQGPMVDLVALLKH